MLTQAIMLMYVSAYACVMRYNTLLEQPIDGWDSGHGVVQIVNPEGTDETELRFAYYKNGEFVNRPLTLAPTEDAADQITDIIPTMASLARTFTPDEISALVEELGEDKILELSVLIEKLGKSRLTEILDQPTK